jgi:hypothetical protein
MLIVNGKEHYQNQVIEDSEIFDIKGVDTWVELPYT